MPVSINYHDNKDYFCQQKKKKKVKKKVEYPRPPAQPTKLTNTTNKILKILMLNDVNINVPSSEHVKQFVDWCQCSFLYI